jgi:NAD(P)-dependent dehydrogenase (short-subunit alcohol dehydrogenase family)
MIVITGASDGLGRELVKLFLSEGKRVVGLSRSKCGPGVEHIKTDLLDESSIVKAAERINKDKDKLEVLINCAGVLSIENIDKLTSKEIDRVLGTNIRAPLLLTSELFNKIKKDGADIVNIASTVGLKGYKDQASYGASKWAIRGLSANLQVELKDFPS